MRYAIIAASLLLSNPVAAQATDEFVGAPYPTFRENLRRAGFRPIISGWACQGHDQRCEQYPEMGFCDPHPPGLCTARWRTPDGRRIVSVSTLGSTPVVYIVTMD